MPDNCNSPKDSKEVQQCITEKIEEINTNIMLQKTENEEYELKDTLLTEQINTILQKLKDVYRVQDLEYINENNLSKYDQIIDLINILSTLVELE